MSERKFHINDDGDVRLCKASVKECQFETNGGHFDTPQEARAIVEAKYSDGSLERKKTIQKKPKGGLERVGVITLDELRTIMGSGASAYKMNGVPMPLHKDRLQLFMRDEMKCVKCGLKASFAAGEKVRNSEGNNHLNVYGTNSQGNDVLFTKDHIMPKSLGGPNHVDNYQIMCQPCNGQKGNSESIDFRSNVNVNNESEREFKQRVALINGAKDLLKAINKDDEMLPPVEDPKYANDEEMDEEDSYVKTMNAFKVPKIAANNCIIVAESIEYFNKQSKIFDNLSIIMQDVEGPNLNVHAANKFTDERGQEWVIDYTYSQVDPTAAFPHVAKVNDWREAVSKAGYESLDELHGLWKATL